MCAFLRPSFPPDDDIITGFTAAHTQFIDSSGAHFWCIRTTALWQPCQSVIQRNGFIEYAEQERSILQRSASSPAIPIATASVDEEDDPEDDSV